MLVNALFYVPQYAFRLYQFVPERNFFLVQMTFVQLLETLFAAYWTIVVQRKSNKYQLSETLQ